MSKEIAIRCSQKYMHGYDVYTSDLSSWQKKYLCPLCKMVCRGPIRTSNDRLACEFCYFHTINAETKTCPIDGSKLDLHNVIHDKSVQSEIANLTFKCRNAGKWCMWRGKVQDVDAHNENCHCPKFVAELPLSIVRKLSPVLQLSDLVAMAESLGFSRHEMIALKCSETGEHRAAKSFVQTLCQQKCRLKIADLREALASLDFCAPEAIQVLKDYRNDEELHRIGMLEILELAWELTIVRGGECGGKTWKDLAVRMGLGHKIPAFVQAGCYGVVRAETPVDAFFSSIQTCHPNLEISQLIEVCLDLKLDSAVNILMKLFNNDSPPPKLLRGGVKKPEKLTTSRNSNQEEEEEKEDSKSAEQKNVVATNCKITLESVMSFCGQFVWPVKNFQSICEEIKTLSSSGKIERCIFSPHFYSHCYGYKFRLRLYPLGNGKGRNTHMSLFLILCKGEFDEILKFPLSGRLYFTLLSRGGTENLCESYQFNSANRGCEKPTTQENAVSLGNPTFCSLDLLWKKYVLNDTVYIRVSVFAF